MGLGAQALEFVSPVRGRVNSDPRHAAITATHLSRAQEG